MSGIGGNSSSSPPETSSSVGLPCADPTSHFINYHNTSTAVVQAAREEENRKTQHVGWDGKVTEGGWGDCSAFLILADVSIWRQE